MVLINNCSISREMASLIQNNFLDNTLKNYDENFKYAKEDLLKRFEECIESNKEGIKEDIL